MLKIESTVDIYRKILLTRHIDQSPCETKKAAEWDADLNANKE